MPDQTPSFSSEDFPTFENLLTARVQKIEESARLWGEREMSLHFGLADNLQPLCTVYPNLVSRKKVESSLGQEVTALFASADFAAFQSGAGLKQRDADAWFKMPSFLLNAPLPAPAHLESWLDTVWRSDLQSYNPSDKAALRRIAKLSSTVLRYQKLPGLSTDSLLNAVLVTLAVEQLRPGTVNPLGLRVCRVLAKVAEDVLTQLSHGNCLALADYELALLDNLKFARIVLERVQKNSVLREAIKTLEERYLTHAYNVAAGKGYRLLQLSEKVRSDSAEWVSSLLSKGPAKGTWSLLGNISSEIFENATQDLRHLIPKVSVSFEKPQVNSYFGSDTIRHHQRYGGFNSNSADFNGRNLLGVQSLLCRFVLEVSSTFFASQSDRSSCEQSRSRAWMERASGSPLMSCLMSVMPSPPPALRAALFRGVVDNASDIVGQSQSIKVCPLIQRLETAPFSAAAFKKLTSQSVSKAYLTASDIFLLGGPAVSERVVMVCGQPKGFSRLRYSFLTFKVAQWFPGLFFNLEFLSTGHVCLKPDLEAKLRLWEQVGGLFGSYMEFLLAGCIPFAIPPSGQSERQIVNPKFLPTQVSDVLVLNSRNERKVKVHVEFHATGVNSFAEVMDQAIRALQTGSERETGQFDLGSFSSLEFNPTFFFEIDGRTFSEENWLSSKKVGHEYRLPDGTLLPADDFNRCAEIYLLRKKALRRFNSINFKQVFRASQFENTSEKVSLSPEEYLENLSISISGLEQIFDERLPRAIAEKLDDLQKTWASNSQKLRAYQQYGAGWILSRFRLGLGSCLADDMGLGKTAQAIVAVATLRDSSPQKPSLVVCPKSLLLNWLREFSTFAPHLRVRVFEDAPLDLVDLDIAITSYPRLRLRGDEFKKIKWNCVVLDEAHQIKNPESQTSVIVNQLKCMNRLALTGTPLENHASELWNLMNWLNPGWLGSCHDFENYTKIARSREAKQLMLAPLRQMLSPVLLRRLKDDPTIAIDLPDKVIRTLDVSLSEEQITLYEAVILAAIESTNSDELAFLRSTRYLKAISHLKQICNHPDSFLFGTNEADSESLTDELPEMSNSLKRKLVSILKAQKSQKVYKASFNELDAIVSRSGKLAAFSELLTSLHGNRGGILIFTQYHSAAELIQKVLGLLDPKDWSQVPHFHGGMNGHQREAMIEAFQRESHLRRIGKGSEAAPVMIVSLKAGGVGLNLTGANQVIHFDRWWNPAVEDQATDRAHRIGQSQTVFVTSFRSVETIEEGIAEMLESKRLLARDLLGGAASESVSDFLKGEEGFLRLVDPRGTFRRKFISSTANSSKSSSGSLSLEAN